MIRVICYIGVCVGGGGGGGGAFSREFTSIKIWPRSADLLTGL